MLAAYATAAGGPEPLANLVLGERELPRPRPGTVRLRVGAASLNHHDLWTLAGVGAPSHFPWTLGCDVAGVVDAYAEGEAGELPPGAPVVAHSVVTCGRCEACLGPDETSCRHFAMLSEEGWEGTFAEYCLVPAGNLFPLPPGLGPEEACCLPTAYLTAYRMLFTKARLRPGQTVLVQGAGGGLAVAAQQLAQASGLRLIVLGRDPAKLDAARERGVREALELGPETVGQVLRVTGGRGVDAVLDSVGEATFGTSLRVLRRGGSLVVAGATSGDQPPADLRRLFWRQLSVLGSTMGTRAEFASLLGFVSGAGIRPLVQRVYPLREAGSALAELAAGGVSGKLVLDCS